LALIPNSEIGNPQLEKKDEKEGLYEKLKEIFYDGSRVYGFNLSNSFLWSAGVWAAEVYLKI
jgi:hypothetical protein